MSQLPSQLPASSVRGPPRVDPGAAGLPGLAREYEAKAKQRRQCIQAYAKRVLAASRPTVTIGADGVRDVTIGEDSRASVDEVQCAVSHVMPEEGDFATALNWRGFRACGLQPQDSYRLRTADGAVIAFVGRNYIPAELAAAWPAVEQHHSEHADMWCLGCEAEPDTNLERTAAAFKSAAGAAGYRIQKGMRVHEFGPRNGDTDNKLVVTYTNREGRTVENFGIGGCPIERHHHNHHSLDLLREQPRAAGLLQCLESAFEEHVVHFLEQKGFPALVSSCLLHVLELASLSLSLTLSHSDWLPSGASRVGGEHSTPLPSHFYMHWCSHAAFLLLCTGHGGYEHACPPGHNYIACE